MKRALLAAAFISIIGLVSVSAQRVYVAGQDNGNAVYWIDGVRNTLSAKGYTSEAVGTTVSGSNIYIAGNEYYEDFDVEYCLPVYWLNGRRVELPIGDFDSATINAIASSGSDVIAAGYVEYWDWDDADYDEFYAVYWRNGTLTELDVRSDDSSAWDILISSSNVYIAGRDGSNAVYWLNGRRTELPKTKNSAKARGITVSGQNVYVVGQDGNEAVYWLNGVRYALPSASGKEAAADRIIVSGSNIYITGFDDDVPVYWLNGRMTALPKASSDYKAWASGIAVSGSNVYIAGNDNEAVFWLNGRRTALPKIGVSGRSSAYHILVVR